MRVALRSVGWLFIASGAVVALYLVYSLYWTGLSTDSAQEDLREQFEQQVADAEEFSLDVAAPTPLDEGADTPIVEDAQTLPPDAELGDAVGVMEFRRPSEDAAVVIDDPVVVVEGVTVDALKDGPGRYPNTSYPGEPGNFAVAGHRTTYGAPFWNLDQLREGDEIHFTDRNGTTWIYEYVDEVIVAPSDISVLDADPIGVGRPLLTLTTCNPRWSQRERLIVHAQLSEEQLPMVASGSGASRSDGEDDGLAGA